MLDYTYTSVVKVTSSSIALAVDPSSKLIWSLGSIWTVYWI